MPLPILDPRHYDASFGSTCALAIMAKAPVPGKVKTRLSPPLTAEQAAHLNRCFLMDTTANISALASTYRCTGVISYTPVGAEHLFDGLLPEDFRLVPQRGNGFGERLQATAQDLFSCGFGSICLVDSDSPTLPAEAFLTAVETLEKPGDRVVVGPSHDGGYYLIGMKRLHPELFADIAWSTETVFEETVAAIQRIGVELVTLPLWYDVDDAATLATLQDELIHHRAPSFATLHGYAARTTQAFLRQLDWQA